MLSSNLKRLPLPLLALIIVVSACAGSGYSIRGANLYNNTYEETVDGVNRALKMASMQVVDAKELSNDEYYVQYFLSRYQIAEQNNQSAHTAEVYVKRISDQATEIRIVEEEQPTMIPNEYKQHLARDLYRQINKILDHAELEDK
jgi:outer membrane lipopolysaccharide assembly protein LptE/RlpB